MILPLSDLTCAKACDLDGRIARFTEFHGQPPTETSTWAEWMAVTPSIADRVWAVAYVVRPKHLDRADLIDAALREIAILAAEAVLPIWEAAYPNDDRPRKAIEAARGCDKQTARAAASRAADAASAASSAAWAAWAAADLDGDVCIYTYASSAAWAADAAPDTDFSAAHARLAKLIADLESAP